MSLVEIRELVELVGHRTSRDTFIGWFCQYWQNILHNDVNPRFVYQTFRGDTYQRVFDENLLPQEQRQIDVFRQNEQSTDPEIALSLPWHLETTHFLYFIRQKRSLQELVNLWSIAFLSAVPRSPRYPRSLSHRIMGHGSGGSWDFLNFPEYLPFFYVMMRLPPAPYGIEIQIPSVMRDHPDQFRDRRRPNTRVTP